MKLALNRGPEGRIATFDAVSTMPVQLIYSPTDFENSRLDQDFKSLPLCDIITSVNSRFSSLMVTLQ